MTRPPSRYNGAYNGSGNASGNGSGTGPGNGAGTGSGGSPAGLPVGPNAGPIVGEELQTGHEARFRYHRESFRRSLIIAIGLTALVCGLVWLLLGIYGSRYMNLVTAIAGLVFFAFISARMIANYMRDEIVLAVQPTGLLDIRLSADPIPWEAIKELVLIRREQEFALRIVLWPVRGRDAREHEIDLSVLEGGARPVLDAIGAYMPVRLER